jgi:hypothetical protein
MNNLFTVEETNLVCIFQSDRTKVIEDIHKAMKHIDYDELVNCRCVWQENWKA